MGTIIEHREILISKYNEYPFEEAKKWAKGFYRRARTQEFVS